MQLRHAVVLALVHGSLACDGRPKQGGAAAGGSSWSAAETNRAAILDLSAGVPEQEAAGLFGMSGTKKSFDAFVRTVTALESDASVSVVFVRFGSAMFGFARAEEIGARLAALRAKKKVFCHGEGFTNATYLAASVGCSEIALGPSGEVGTIGIAAQVVYLRKLLEDELKLSVDILHVGKFKGTAEPFTRDGPSPEARASLEGFLGDLRSSWLSGVAKGRPKVTDVVLEDGPYGPKHALARGLVDGIEYADATLERAKSSVSATKEVTLFGKGAKAEGDEFTDLLRAMSSDGGALGPIALVRATGSISMAGGGGLFGGSGGITEKDLGRLLMRVEKDDSVKVVVLRIDSPGGSALASDLLWHRLMRIRKKKPIVVSVGEMAASGGYYLASTANVVFADPSSIVGSIGVVGGKVGFASALERFGVHTETFAAAKGKPGAGARAGYESPLTPWDDATRGRVLESMEEVYDLFLSRVSEGRGMPVEKVAESAEGRIFSGNEAKRRGLIDRLGGLADAIDEARVLAKLPSDAEVVAVATKAGFVEGLEGGDRDGASSSVADAALGTLAPTPFLSNVFRALPELVTFAAALDPMLRGERVLGAMPFALIVR